MKMPKCSDCLGNATVLELRPIRKATIEEANHREVRLSGGSLATMLPPAAQISEWRFMCDRCGGQPIYHVPLNRLQTERHALSWTLHLIGTKVWFRETLDSWRDVLRTLFPDVEAFA